jgi:hypothetical protein
MLREQRSSWVGRVRKDGRDQRGLVQKQVRKEERSFSWSFFSVEVFVIWRKARSRRISIRGE